MSVRSIVNIYLAFGPLLQTFIDVNFFDLKYSLIFFHQIDFCFDKGPKVL